MEGKRAEKACYADRAAFKIFVLDVGLLGAMAGLKAATVIEGRHRAI